MIILIYYTIEAESCEVPTKVNWGQYSQNSIWEQN